MKILGVEIKGRNVRLCLLELNVGDISDITGSYKPISLDGDEIAENVVLFRNTIFAVFDHFQPNNIIIKQRNHKVQGKLAPSPISFKIEGIIQLYSNSAISFVSPNTIAAFFKKNECSLNPSFGYQEEALKVAYHFAKTRV